VVSSQYRLRDAEALENRRQVWHERLGAADASWGAYIDIDNLHVVHDWVGRALMRAALAAPGGGSAPNCRYVWPDARALL
jgi:hypothetical protein